MENPQATHHSSFQQRSSVNILPRIVDNYNTSTGIADEDITERYAIQDHLSEAQSTLHQFS
jgi:hypothetical protein